MADGETGARLHTAATTRHSTVAAATSASVICGTPTAAVGQGCSLADGVGDERRKVSH